MALKTIPTGVKLPINKGVDYINDAIDSVNKFQTQIDTIVVEGDSSVEAAQARIDVDGESHTTLKARIDDDVTKLRQKDNEITTLLADIPNQPFIQEKATKTDLTNAISPKASREYVDNVVQSIASGSPKGVYATVSALHTAFPSGNTNVYVVSADGKWYLWNGTAWVAGGIYQGVGVSNEIINLVNGAKKSSNPFENSTDTTITNLLNITDPITPINGTLTQDNSNAWGLSPYGWKLSTVGAVNSEIRSTFTTPKTINGVAAVGVMLYIPDVTKINAIQLHIDTSGTYNWVRASSNSPYQLKNGWNLFRWAANTGVTTNWGTFNRFRFVVITNAATEYTLGSIFFECKPKAQILFIQDGGYRGFFEKGYPQLKSRGIPITWALTPGRIGNTNILTDEDIEILAEDVESDFNFHSWESTPTSTMTASELKKDTIKCQRWLQLRGLQPKYWWRSAFTQNNAPNHSAIQDMVEAYGTPNGIHTLGVFPFIDRWNVGRYILHNKPEEEMDSVFDTLKKTHQLLVCYTHDINDAGGSNMTNQEWNYFISKIDEGIAGGWLEGVTYDILRNRHDQQFGGFGFEKIINMS